MLKNKFLGSEIHTDVAIIGGGLAGLSLSILLARAGRKVILLEKERYPFHRVCGEYISMESWQFLEELGMPMKDLNLPLISNLQLSSPKGRTINLALPLGGFGFSRYSLDAALAGIAGQNGVHVWEGKKVTGIVFLNNEFHTECSDRTMIISPVCFGTFGKRSNLDVKWKRPFTVLHKSTASNYVGVKYHVTGDFSPDTIGLHLFPGGYCGIVKVDGGKFNFCYLTTASQLQRAGSIPLFEKNILCQNPLLRKIYQASDKINSGTSTVSQVSFRKKNQVEDHVLLAGDAAGMIPPLCGNGMSMALHAGKIAFELVEKFLDKKIGRPELESGYISAWQKEFSQRFATGRVLQKITENEAGFSLLITIGMQFPGLLKYLVRKTHGTSF